MRTLRSSTLRLALLSLLVAPAAGCDDEDDGGTPSMQENGGMDEGEEPKVCIEQCEPLEQDCGPGRTCLPDQPGFSCATLSSVEEGTRRGLHDACEAGSQTCNAGLVCLQVAVPGCTGGSGCCVAYCDVERPECTDGTSCYPVFEAVQMCYEEVGVCVLF